MDYKYYLKAFFYPIVMPLILVMYLYKYHSLQNFILAGVFGLTIALFATNNYTDKNSIKFWSLLASGVMFLVTLLVFFALVNNANPSGLSASRGHMITIMLVAFSAYCFFTSYRIKVL